MTRSTVKRTFTYRFYPTDAQAAELSRTFGWVRLVCNRALDLGTRAWFTEQRRGNHTESSAALTAWKKDPDLALLNEVSSVPLQQALRHLQAAFRAFFSKRAQYPRFKSKKTSRAAAECTRSGVTHRHGALFLATMAQPLDIVWSQPLPADAQPTTATVSQDGAERWGVSMRCEDTPRPAPASDRAVRVAAGPTCLAVLSTGEKIANPKHEFRDRARLAKAQRELSRTQKGSNTRAKARRRVARMHTRITDRRRDFLRKLSTRLLCGNQVVVIEDLRVRSLVNNHKLARAVSGTAWSELRSMLEYKCAWRGRELVAIDRFFPSSTTCSTRGAPRKTIPLNVRTWTCDCGVTHDRDVNAAINIKTAGLAASVGAPLCDAAELTKQHRAGGAGAGVRPQRESSRTGQSARQQTQRAAAGLSSR
ncbi:RNA-guided endonuclease InsQ/TnpB family protein [Salinactinospora qingdaonensis]|uniref:RNA-guided endonuclease InsQ/TnpB family protein n=1 Tax=Salinactinospora qingdaonensis TaxID=702744 RepID=UPI0031EA3EF2